MDDLSRSEYPAMLAHLQPSQAVQTLNDRVKRISKLNQEIADWLQERRKVEDLYVQGLRKLLLFKVPNAQSELGVFQAPWDKLLQSTDAIAASHNLLAQRIEKDVEQSLRGFQGKKEMHNMHTISTNLVGMAKELDDAQNASDKLNRKAGKASAQKVDAAATRLDTASQQWESQAPFIFETMQALDEQRVNHLRDVLTQLQTHEIDQASRTTTSAEDVLNTVLEINTAQEISNYAQKTTAGRPKIEKRPSARPSIGGSSNLAPPSVHTQDDDASEHSAGKEAHPESKLRSRIGTMLGRRRQSVHGFGQISPQKGLGTFSRGISSSHGKPGLSPRASINNMSDSNNRLTSLAETPESPLPPGSSGEQAKRSHEGTNGIGYDGHDDSPPAESASALPNGATAEDIFDAPPPPGPPPSQRKEEPEPAKDAEGFTIPPVMNDPISQAQLEAAEENDQVFKLNIQKEPVAEEDPDAKRAALSNVANSLAQMNIPSRKAGTVRGRRDVRSTIYVPSTSSGLSEISTESSFPPTPALPSAVPKSATIGNLASEASIAGTSDTQSVRSATSLGSMAHFKHPELAGPGLNSSIVEIVSASFEDGAIKSAHINGEIAFSYNTSEFSTLSHHEQIRINNFANLEKIGPNRIFVSNATPDKPDEFTLDVSHLSKTSIGFSYRVHGDDEGALAAQLPLALRTAWKPQGDKLGLLLQYGLSPACRLPAPVTLHNLVLVAHYEGARASGAQTKPAGTHLKDKQLVYWRLGDVTLGGGDEWHKIVCRIVGFEKAEPVPGLVEARWEYVAPAGTEAAGAGSAISISRLLEGKGKGKEVVVAAVPEEDEADGADPFSDDAVPATPRTVGNWVDVPLVRRLISGKYEAR